MQHIACLSRPVTYVLILCSADASNQGHGLIANCLLLLQAVGYIAKRNLMYHKFMQTLGQPWRSAFEDIAVSEF